MAVQEIAQEILDQAVGLAEADQGETDQVPDPVVEAAEVDLAEADQVEAVVEIGEAVLAETEAAVVEIQEEAVVAVEIGAEALAEIGVAVEEETEEALEKAISTEARKKCTKQHVPNVRKNAKFHLNQHKANQFIARNVFLNKETTNC